MTGPTCPIAPRGRRTLWKGAAVFSAYLVLGGCAAITGLNEYSELAGDPDATASSTSAPEDGPAPDAAAFEDVRPEGAPADAPEETFADVVTPPDTQGMDGGSCSTLTCMPSHVAHAVCNGSVCSYDACQPGFGDCDGNSANGCETDLGSDPRHCGSCGVTCSTGLCGTSISGWSTSPSLWKVNGSATIGSGQLGSQTAILTANMSGLAGSINYVNPIVTDSFTATFSAYLGGGGGADGMGFMWQTQGATAIGGGGGCLGMCGLPGYGVELDTYNNSMCGDTSSNHVAVDQLTGCSGAYPTHIRANSMLPMLDNGTHAVVVTMTSGAVSVSIDGTSYLSNVALPGFTSGAAYYYGFAGGTGGVSDLHEVSPALTITFPTPRCL